MPYLFGELIMHQEVAEVIPEFYFGGCLLLSTPRASLTRCAGISSSDCSQSETLLSPDPPRSPKSSPTASQCDASLNASGLMFESERDQTEMRKRMITIPEQSWEACVQID